jgi:hypothetical protein
MTRFIIDLPKNIEDSQVFDIQKKFRPRKITAQPLHLKLLTLASERKRENSKNLTEKYWKDR